MKKSLRPTNKLFFINRCCADAVTSDKMKHSALQEPNALAAFLTGSKQIK